ncbi:MAG: heparan-alpha-glucosaminide N-acetyltransferase domain-containing protein [Muribaculaceae bacterium]|nr:heparan-alpha-glucosaminide N-acetyltransferase domain-containing protein [Muribaculaceae bacterium]
MGNEKTRLLSLDVLRGITIVGMIIVNNAGACGFGYVATRHVKWDGLNPADLVFPMFMFLMGISTYISLRKFNFDWRLSLTKILRRSFLLILIGITMKWLVNSCDSGVWNDWENMRILGVMQRLGICYGLTAIFALFIPHKHFLKVAIGMLAGYLLLQVFGNGFEKNADNIMSIVDNAVLGVNHMYMHGKQFVEPEGVLSTIPATAQVMLGFVCGRAIIEMKDNDQKMIRLFLAGVAMLFIGWLLSYGCPINKRLWSPSFVLVTSGVAALSFGALLYVIDVKGYKKWTTFFVVIGINPLALYVLSYILGELFRFWSFTDISFNAVLQPLFGDYFGSFMYSVLFLLLNWIVGYALYKKKIYIKI